MFDWNDANVELLRTRWREGVPASAIAIELGAPTRNCVIGKAHRMGLGRRDQPASRPKISRPNKLTRMFDISIGKMQAEQPAPPTFDQVLVNEPAFNGAFAVGLLGLKDEHCRWPCGDPQDPGFLFCGAPRIKDGSYCNAHHLIGHNAPPRKTTVSQEERVERRRMERKQFGGVFA